MSLIAEEKKTVNKEKETEKEIEEYFELHSKLREINKKAHENDLVRCGSCRKPFHRHQLELPRYRGRLASSIPKRHQKLYCNNCKETILQMYVRACKICGEDFIANNSQRTCKKCWGKDQDNIRRQVKSELARARKLNKPATLTLSEWQATIDHFQGLCAYCQRYPFEVLEHFIPLSLKSPGGGTTADNCVPACTGCNGIKAKFDPTDESQLIYFYSSIRPKDIERIYMYLNSQKHA